MYRIKLTPYTPEQVKFQGRDTFRVRIVASDAEDMPNEIFGFQRTLVDAVTGRYQDEFSFVCSAYDLSTFPTCDPDPTQDPPFFRKSTIDVLLPSVTLAQDFINEVSEQVCALISQLNALDDLTASEPIWCPSPPDSTTTTTTTTTTTEEPTTTTTTTEEPTTTTTTPEP